MIPNTLFKLTKFEYKIRRDASTGIDEDVSELTIKNSKTGATVVLVFQKTIDATAAGAAK